MRADLRVPLSTYRLQFNQQFRFQDALKLVGYLQGLGISDVYASPLLQARRGSPHGYDVTDPTRLNAELGSDEEFGALVREIRRHRMGLLLDIVPNHMAASGENPWWRGVLENGLSSAYAAYFDIEWHPPRRTLDGRVLLPILGRPYAETLEGQELSLGYDKEGFSILYYDMSLPVAPKSYRSVLQYGLERLERTLGHEHPAYRELVGILAALQNLPGRDTHQAEVPGERRLQREAIKERLWQLYTGWSELRTFIEGNVLRFNGKKGRPGSFLLLDRLLSEQAYVLAFWRSANEEINYRRFFAISDLVGMRVEDPLVFEATHAVIAGLVARGEVTGLRIDHIDGLRDPLGYLRRLRETLTPPGSGAAPAEFYVSVEKILSGGEMLPAGWPVAGTTGYAFLNALNGVFVDARGARALDEIYARFLGSAMDFDDLVYEKKKEVMEILLAVEMRALGHHLSLLAEQDRYARELPRQDLEAALVETTACLPVYRTYVRSSTVAPPEREYIERAIGEARRRAPALADAIDFLRQVLTLEERAHIPPEQREARLAFVMRWQQFTGPITAKGFEDSVLYIYNRLISLNEVGGAPRSFGVPPAEFHRFILARQRRRPGSQNATSTHDTKRSEDVRARINVLSELPSEWQACLRRWSHWNRGKKRVVDGQSVPVPNEEIHLYQTLLGAWPLESGEGGQFRARLRAYMVKATREAMVYTKWTLPNAGHERALAEFVDGVLEPSGSNRFLTDFLRFQAKVAHFGAINSLGQVIIKIASPGAPDFYQGSELWDLRLVDPDNRGPVNFEMRMRQLDEICQKQGAAPLSAFIEDLLRNWPDGRIKLYVTYRALQFRAAHPDLFGDGAYLPLNARGERRDNVCAFARRRRNGWALAAVPRLATRLCAAPGFPLGRRAWGRSTLSMPSASPARWTNVLTGETLASGGEDGRKTLGLSEMFRSFPVALLAGGSARDGRRARARGELERPEPAC